MKQLFMLVAIAIVAISCNKLEDNQFEVTGSIEGLEKDNVVILERQNEMGQFVPVDSTVLKNGKFSFIREFTEPEFQYIQFKNLEGKVPFIVENGKITLTIYKDSIQRSFATGTYSNDQYVAYVKESDATNKKRNQFQQENTATWFEAQQKQDTATMNALMKENKKYEDELIAIGKKLIKEHPKSFISALFLDHLAGMETEDKVELKKLYDNV
jgi:hypothetical protein